MEHCWDDNGRGKVKYYKSNPTYRHFDYNLATMTGLWSNPSMCGGVGGILRMRVLPNSNGLGKLEWKMIQRDNERQPSEIVI